MTDGIRVCSLLTLAFFESSIDFCRLALKSALRSPVPPFFGKLFSCPYLYLLRDLLRQRE